MNSVCSDCKFVYVDAMGKNSPFGSTDCWKDMHPENNTCKSYNKKEKDGPGKPYREIGEKSL